MHQILFFGVLFGAVLYNQVPSTYAESHSTTLQLVGETPGNNTSDGINSQNGTAQVVTVWSDYVRQLESGSTTIQPNTGFNQTATWSPFPPSSRKRRTRKPKSKKTTRATTPRPVTAAKAVDDEDGPDGDQVEGSGYGKKPKAN